MYAVVCDLCGKTVLLDTDKPLMNQPGFYRMTCSEMFSTDVLDLCEECANKLLEKVKETRGEC